MERYEAEASRGISGICKGLKRKMKERNLSGRFKGLERKRQWTIAGDSVDLELDSLIA